MRKIGFLALLLMATIFACKQFDQNRVNRLTNTSKLPSSTYSIDITRDTALITKKGAVIKITAGSLQSSTSIVQLEIKEAYSITDIVKAGLITRSNNEPLSSGGMIYINAVSGQEVKIAKAISVAIPTSSLNPAMQLYKGEIKNDSSVNWVDPQPLEENPQAKALNAGKALFESKCASCHEIGKDIAPPAAAAASSVVRQVQYIDTTKLLSGPDLAHIVKRSPGITVLDARYTHNILYDFTRNNLKVLGGETEVSGYYRCLFRNWNGAPMPLFPDLTETDLNNLYGFIENESELRNLPVPNNGILSCLDSCRIYHELKDKWERVKRELEGDSSQMVEEQMDFGPPDTTRVPSAIFFDSSQSPTNTVMPMTPKSLYYQFNVETVGWYNVDLMLKEFDGLTETKTTVRLQGKYKEQLTIYLVVPAVKAFLPGGPITGNADVYGFYRADGTVPLPLGAKAFVVAMGEYEDQLIFTKKEFTVGNSQELSLEMKVTSKEIFEHEIAAMELTDITIGVNEKKNSAELRNAIKQLRSAELLKPKNCNCDCFLLDRVIGIPGAEGAESSNGTASDYLNNQ